MFRKILGLGKKDNSEIKAKLSEMTLSDMRSYLNNNIKNFESSEEGLIEIMSIYTQTNPKTGKRYVEADDMDSKMLAQVGIEKFGLWKNGMHHLNA